MDPTGTKIPWRGRGARGLGTSLPLLLALGLLEGGAGLALALLDAVRGRPDLCVDVVHRSPGGYGVVAQPSATESGFADPMFP